MDQNDYNNYNQAEQGNNGAAYPGQPYQQPYQQQYQQQYQQPYQQQYQQPYQQQYQQPYQPYLNPNERPGKSSNAWLWVIIGVAATIIVVAAILLFYMLGRNSQPEYAEAASTEAVTSAQHTPSVNEPSAPAKSYAEQISTPYLDRYTAWSSLAGQAATGHFANTYDGITADAFRSLKAQGKVGRNRGSDFLRVTSAGITYSYVFKNGSVSDPNAPLTSVGADWTMDYAYEAEEACSDFDAQIRSQGGDLVAGDYGNRSIYRMPNGNYVSCGHSGRKFIVYYYYTLFENSLYDNAAPRN